MGLHLFLETLHRDFKLLNNLGLLRSHILLLTNIFIQVMESFFAIDDTQLP